MSKIGRGSGSGAGVPSPFSYSVSAEGKLQLRQDGLLIMEQSSDGTWVRTGLYTGASSIHLGGDGSSGSKSHTMTVGGQNVAFINEWSESGGSKVAFSPAWEGISCDGETILESSTRIYEPLSAYEPAGAPSNPNDAANTRPCIYETTASENLVIFNLVVIAKEAYVGRIYANIESNFVDSDGSQLSGQYEEFMTTDNGSLNFTFEKPYWLNIGDKLKISLLKEDGTPLQVLKGTTDQPWRMHNARRFEFKQIALKDDLDAVAAGAVTIGDVKQGYQQGDHGGWFLMNGRPVVSLTLKAQESAASIGLGSSLPDMGDKTVFGANSPSYVGDLSGGNTIRRVNLPNVGLSFNGTSAANNRGHTHKIDPPATNSGSQSKNHTHNIPALEGSTWTVDAAPLGTEVATTTGFWGEDYGANLGGSTRNFAWTSLSNTLGSSKLSHNHKVSTTASVTEGNNQNHSHSVNIAEFTSAAESQNHTHTYSGTTESMNGGATQASFMPAHLKLNYFVYLGE